nr:MAG TPA: hypothetical protein [Caudoviricetes sp.]
MCSLGSCLDAVPCFVHPCLLPLSGRNAILYMGIAVI